MKKVFCEITLNCSDEKNRTYKCCGVTQKDAEQKLLKQFSGDKIVSCTVLHEYDESDYGWV